MTSSIHTAASEADGKAARVKKMEVLNKQIADWNNNYSVGSRVTVAGYEKELKTRTRALVLFGHRAAIYLQGYKGYFALDDVTPVG